MLLAVIAVVGGCGNKQDDSGHQRSADPKVAVYEAAVNAPPGKTECESLLNALKAFDEATIKANIPPGWERFPATDELLARCNALPAEAQYCLVPKHQYDKARCGPVLEALEKSDEGKRYFELVRPKKP